MNGTRTADLAAGKIFFGKKSEDSGPCEGAVRTADLTENTENTENAHYMAWREISGEQHTQHTQHTQHAPPANPRAGFA